jgi:hypothetical protein
MTALRYSEALTVQVQPGFRSLIDTAALRAGTKPTEWTRQALTDALRASGIDPAPKASSTAGALYDSRIERGQPQQRFAWVEDGAIKAVGYHEEKPGDGWLPVVHVDSEPFDAVQHWRLAPLFTIETDKVTCTYPVVVKSLEHV